MPFEFEADEHFLKDFAMVDIEPISQEPDVGGDDDHDDHVWKKSYIEIEDYGRIASKEDYIQYMEKIKLSKIKSARK